MGNGIKVYFIPLITLYNDAYMIVMYGALKRIREISYIEKVDKFHCHQSVSILSLEWIWNYPLKILGKNVVFA